MSLKWGPVEICREIYTVSSRSHLYVDKRTAFDAQNRKRVIVPYTGNENAQSDLGFRYPYSEPFILCSYD